MFSQWVRSIGAPLGRLNWPQVSGVWGIFKRERTARNRIRTANTGKIKRMNAVYHDTAMGYAAKKPVTVSSAVWSAVITCSMTSASFSSK